MNCLSSGDRAGRRSSLRVALPSRRHRGFTLVELLIALSIGIVLIVIAVPSFKSMILSSKLTTAANDFVASIHTARLEAIKLNANAQVCGNVAADNGTDTLGAACTVQIGAVYATTGSSATQVREGTQTIAGQLKVNGGMVPLRFGGTGLAHKVTDSTPYTGTVLDICTSSLGEKNHRVIEMVAGSVIKVTTTTSATCS